MFLGNLQEPASNAMSLPCSVHGCRRIRYSLRVFDGVITILDRDPLIRGEIEWPAATQYDHVAFGGELEVSFS
jgi:hypothetical protein